MGDQGERIRKRRKELGLSQRTLAKAVGAHMQTIDKIERGQIKFSRYLFPIAQRLGIVTDLSLPGGKPPALPPATAPSAQLLFADERDLPVHGSERVGWEMRLTAEPIAYTLRPQPLATVKAAFGALVSTTAHDPIFEVGDTILIDPHKPPEVGKDVLLVSDDNVVAIGRLIGYSERKWTLRQWNRGAKPISYDRAKWPRCQRIMGKYSR